MTEDESEIDEEEERRKEEQKKKREEEREKREAEEAEVEKQINLAKELYDPKWIKVSFFSQYYRDPTLGHVLLYTYLKWIHLSFFSQY